MQKLTIDIDLDGIAADFFGPLLDKYNDLTNNVEAVVQDDISSWNMSDHVGDPALLKSIYHAKGFFRNLPPLPGAVEAIQSLVDDGHEVHIVTSGCTPHSFGEKAEWCAQHLPFIPLGHINISHKKGRYGDTGHILIDDGPHNARAYRARNLWAAVFSIEHPHNRHEAEAFTKLCPGHKDTAAAWCQILKEVRDYHQ